MKRSLANSSHARLPASLEGELKYTIPSNRTKTAIALLDSRLDADPKFPAGVISSIYFDSRDWVFLGEKRNSDYLKTKIRLRWYAPLAGSLPADKDMTFAEAKYRVGSRRMKIRRRMTFSGEQLRMIRLDSPDLMSVPQELRRAGVVCPKAIFPTFVVRYIRRRYVDRLTGKRVCIDYKITTPRVNQTILSTPFPFELTKAVIEVKSLDLEFPRFLRPFLALGLNRTAFSKYYECYAALTRTIF